MKKTGYYVFLMIELAKLKGIISTELEYDIIWDEGEHLIDDFEGSVYNNPKEGIYECIEAFLNAQPKYVNN